MTLGLRSTVSLFSSDEGSYGSGAGGQFRLQLAEKVNTEWFADMITTNIMNAGRRVDGHIGWSVLFYPLVKEKFRPYVLAGHCFDYTRIEAVSYPTVDNSHQDAERWSSAIQAGAGIHYMLTPRFDFSFNAQYMMHLGKDAHAHVHEVNGLPELNIEEHAAASLEGHLLLTFSINYAIADLW